MLSGDMGLIIYVWIWSLLIQLTVGCFFFFRLRKYLVDGGWAFGRLIGWLLVSLGVWMLAHLKLPVNTLVGVNVVGASVLGLTGYQVIRRRGELRKEIRKRWKIILAEEGLFLLGLVGMSVIRGFNPSILDLEKFMDAGFMNSYLKSSTLPASDMWLAGETINYYSFGHFMGSVLARLWQVRMAYGYNLLLGWLMGLGLSQSFSVVINLIKRGNNKVGLREVVGGLIGSLFVMVGGNSHTVWYWLQNKSLTGYWYADATRFIENTIHEFPAYSFVVSDLHAHVWDLPIVLLFVLCLIGFNESRKNAGVWGWILGGIAGVMMMTNTWDFLVYGLLGAGVVLAKWFRREISVSELGWLIGGGVMGVGVIALPWLINFEPIGEGIRWVDKRSLVKELLILWGVHVFLSGLALGWAIKTKNSIVVVMVLVAFGLLVIPEVVYVKDIYPSHPRANTMFKLTYQAFILMGLVIGAMAGGIKKIEVRVVTAPLVVIGLGAVLSFPGLALNGYYNEFRDYKGLDGERWLKERAASDYAGIEWLRKNALEDEVVLEAVGESYTEFARVSAFSGAPTVLGWRVHEWLWRGGFEIPGQRTEEVRLMYEDPVRNQELLMKYRVKYIFVGSKEKEIYEIDDEVLSKLGETVFEVGETKIIKI